MVIYVSEVYISVQLRCTSMGGSDLWFIDASCGSEVVHWVVEMESLVLDGTLIQLEVCDGVGTIGCCVASGLVVADMMTLWCMRR